MKFDALIVGGGPAGLSAALILGQCHRKALLCDEGRQRNLASHAIHGLLGREGRSPAAFLDEARHELTRYAFISLRGTRVTDITPTGDEFEFVCADGTAGIASKILLATGLVTSFLIWLESSLYTGLSLLRRLRVRGEARSCFGKGG